MFTNRRAGWHLAALLALAPAAIGLASAAPAASDEAPAEVKIALAAPPAPAAVVAADAVAEPTMQMNLAEPEKDVLTRQAESKLDAQIGSLTFKETDLADVIRFIGKKLGLNFIFDAAAVQGKVTLTLQNVRVRDALDSILSAQKLAMVPDKGGIFRIVPQAQVGVSQVETKTEVIQLNWVQAADVDKTMKAFLSKEGRIETHEESNIVIITDTPPNVANIKDLIARVDQPERQVMIEARLVDININNARRLGTTWSASKANNNISSITTTTSGAVLSVLNQLLSGVSQASDGTGTVAFGDAVNVLGNQYDLEAAFTALETRNVVETLANPRVSTLNNVPADIHITKNIPYSNTTNNTGTTTVSYSLQETGVEIKVKPIITPNRFVRMEINLDQTIDRGAVVAATTDNPAPMHIVDSRKATTNVIVENGATAVLGGLRQLDTSEITQGTPWLDRIPLFGWLFKTKSANHDRTELVLMITPKIMESAPVLNDRDKVLYNKLDNNWKKAEQFMGAAFDDDGQVVKDKKACDKKMISSAKAQLDADAAKGPSVTVEIKGKKADAAQ
jgi:type IV pilus assembly protein PilQ